MGILRLKMGAAGRAIGSNFAWLVADKIMRLIIGLLVSAWVARYLGPEQFGVLAYALTFIAIFQAITLLGLDNLLVRDIAANPLQAHKYLGTTIGLRCASSTASYIVMMTIAALLNNGDDQALILIAIVGLIIFFQISDVIDLWFQSQLQSRRTVIAKGVSYILTAAIKIGLILSGAGLIAFATALVIEAALALVALSFAYRLFKTTTRWEWSTLVAKELLKQSWPLLISGLAILLYMRISVIFLRESAGNAAVGIYTVGVTLSELWYFIPMAIASSLAPYISRKRNQDGDGYERVVCKAFSVMWILSIAVVTFNVLTAKYWVALLYGDQYKISAEIFALHAFTFVPVCLGVIQSIWLINEGRSILALYQAISGTIVALSLNFILTPTHGAHGAAAAIVVSQFVQAFLVNVFLAPDLFRMQVRSLRFISVMRS
jgi:O-antigen/teichoic acid export membrane protein